MATSGTTSFNLDLSEIIEEAFERAGVEVKNGYDVRTARRSLNLLTLEWANKQVNLWTIEMDTRVTGPGVGTYALPEDTIDILDAVIRTGEGMNQTDVSIKRIPLDVYASLPNKNTQGRPIQYTVNRLVAPQIILWPEPPDDSYQIVIWRMRRIQDSGTNGNLTMDVPFRFIPALVAGLAYYIAVKRPELIDRVAMLKELYEEQWQLAIEEDRDRSSAFLRPYIGR